MTSVQMTDPATEAVKTREGKPPTARRSPRSAARRRRLRRDAAARVRLWRRMRRRHRWDWLAHLFGFHRR